VNTVIAKQLGKPCFEADQHFEEVLDKITAYIQTQDLELHQVVEVSGELCNDPGNEQCFLVSAFLGDSWDYGTVEGSDETDRSLQTITTQIGEWLTSEGDHGEWVERPTILNTTVIWIICRAK